MKKIKEKESNNLNVRTEENNNIKKKNKLK